MGYDPDMKTIDTTDKHFAETLKGLQSGEELLLQVEGKLVAKVVGLNEVVPTSGSNGPPYRQAGFAKGRLIVHDNFEDPLEDFADYM